MIKRKVLSILLAVTVIICIVVPATASNEIISDDVRSAIRLELKYVQLEADGFNLGGVDFSLLKIGAPIYVYEYTASLNEMDFCFYPIFENNELVALALVRQIGNEVVAQISTDYVLELSEVNSGVALVYDRFACYLYTNHAYTVIDNFSALSGPVDSRGVLSTDVDASNIVMQELEPIEQIAPAPMVRSSTYASCNVAYTPRMYSNLSWAASVACISNFLNGNSAETAENVAVDVFGATNFNQSLTQLGAGNVTALEQAMMFIWDYTWVTYDKNASAVPTTSTIYTNIVSGYPLYCILSNGVNCVISGVDIVENRITIMDPTYGFRSGYGAAGTYYFTGANGVTISTGYSAYYI